MTTVICTTGTSVAGRVVYGDQAQGYLRDSAARLEGLARDAATFPIVASAESAIG